MTRNFNTLDRVIGYITRQDPTNVDPRAIVAGSQNVLINEREKLQTRGGYTVFGPTNTADNDIESSFDWDTQIGAERTLRSYDDELVILFTKEDASVVEVRVADGWTNVDFVFDKWWDATEALEVLLFVVGDDNIYEWSGGVAEIDSVTSNTLVKKGTNTWAQEGFYATGNKTLIINGTTYTYTGGEGSTTLTGVTPDPTVQPVSSGDVATQEIRTRVNEPAANGQNDFIRVWENHLVVGSLISNEIDISSNTDYTDYTFSSPRVPGEAAQIIADSPGVGLAVLQRNLLIFAGESDIYKTEFQQLDVGGTLSETLNIRKLKNGVKQGAFSHDFIAAFGTGIAYLSNEPALRILESAIDIENPLLLNVSIPVKPDFDAETFTLGHAKFNDNRIYLTAPTSGLLYILQFQEDEQGNVRRFWQPPQILPLRRMAIIGGVTHGHSNVNPETYKLFDGTSDSANGETLPFKAVATYAYRSFDDRASLKEFLEYFCEGFISENTAIKVTILYDYQGSRFTFEGEINGANTDIIFQEASNASLGQSPLGQNPLGGAGGASLNPKFRAILELAPQDFHEYQLILETNGVDQQWEIISQGPEVFISPNQPTSIKI